MHTHTRTHSTMDCHTHTSSHQHGQHASACPALLQVHPLPRSVHARNKYPYVTHVPTQSARGVTHVSMGSRSTAMHEIQIHNRAPQKNCSRGHRNGAHPSYVWTAASVPGSSGPQNGSTRHTHLHSRPHWPPWSRSTGPQNGTRLSSTPALTPDRPGVKSNPGGSAGRA